MDFQTSGQTAFTDFQNILSDAQFESDQVPVNLHKLSNHTPMNSYIQRAQPIVLQKNAHTSTNVKEAPLAYQNKAKMQKSYHQQTILAHNNLQYNNSRQYQVYQHQNRSMNVNNIGNQFKGIQQRQMRFARGYDRESRLSHQNKSGMMRKNSNSNASMSRRGEDYEMEARYFQMRERLKNLHYFYKIRIKQEKSKTAERNQFFMSMIEQMQNKHNQEIANYKRLVMEVEQQQKDVGLVDDRMNSIKSSVDDILKKSSELKDSNTQLERMINQKESVIRRKENQANILREQLNKLRNKMEEGERQRLKQNKKNKQLLQMINNSQLQ